MALPKNYIGAPVQSLNSRELVSKSYMKNNVWYLELKNENQYSRTKDGEWFRHLNRQTRSLTTLSSKEMEKNYGHFYLQTIPRVKRDIVRVIPQDDDPVDDCSYPAEEPRGQSTNSKRKMIYTEIYKGQTYSRDEDGRWFERSCNVVDVPLNSATVISELEKLYACYKKSVTRVEHADMRTTSVGSQTDHIDSHENRQKVDLTAGIGLNLNKGISSGNSVLLDEKNSSYKQELKPSSAETEGTFSAYSKHLQVDKTNCTFPLEPDGHAATKSQEINFTNPHILVPNCKERPGSPPVDQTSTPKSNLEGHLQSSTFLIMSKADAASCHSTLPFKSLDSRDCVTASNQDLLSDSEYVSISSGSNFGSLRSDVEEVKWSNVSPRTPGFLCKQPDSNAHNLTLDEHLRASALLVNHAGEAPKITLNEQDLKSTSGEKAIDMHDSETQIATSEKSELVKGTNLVRPQFVISTQDTRGEIVSTVSQIQIQNENLHLTTDNLEFVTCQESFKSDVKNILTESSPTIVNQISSVVDNHDSAVSKVSDDSSYDIITDDEFDVSCEPDFKSDLSMKSMKEVIRDAIKTDVERTKMNDETASKTISDDGGANTELARSSTCHTESSAEPTRELKKATHTTTDRYLREECNISGVVKTLTSTEEASQKAAASSVQQVVEDLRRILQEKYKKIAPRFPWHSTKPRFPEHLAFEFETLSRKQGEKTAVNFMEILPAMGTFGHKILVTGHPGFGKSFLCSLLAARWAKSQMPMKQFDLCLHLSLDVLNLTEMKLFQAILLWCKLRLRSTENATHLEAVLKSYTYKIIFVLDGFDKISLIERNSVLACLKTDIRLQHHTVLLTSRTSEVEGLSASTFSLFKSVLSIAGFSLKRLETIRYQTEESKKPLCLKKFWKLEFLTGLSPFFTFLIWRVIAIIDTEKEVKLYDFLEIVMYFLADSLGINNVTQDRLYLKLGNLCYEALMNGYSLFTEELLRRVLEDDFDTFSRTFIFWKPQSPQGISVWHASSKVIVQYLATRYLRCNWLKGNFIKNILSIGICGYGDYVTSRKGKEHAVYKVGFLPDFVLKYTVLKDGNVQGKIEMLHDTEVSIEKSAVFDACNVLLRTKKDRLSRFSFVLHHSNEDSICLSAIELQCFHDVLNLLAFDECNVDYDIFDNTFEKRHFLKVLVSDSQEKPVLSAVFRRNDNSIIDKVIMKFSVRDFHMVLQGFVSLLAWFLPECELKNLNARTEFSVFVYNALLKIIEGCTRKLVLIECFGSVKVTEVGLKKISTLALSVEPALKGNTQNRVLVEQYGLIPSEQVLLMNRIYDPHEFRQLQIWFQELFSTFAKDNCDYTVTVKICDQV